MLKGNRTMYRGKGNKEEKDFVILKEDENNTRKKERNRKNKMKRRRKKVKERRERKVHIVVKVNARKKRDREITLRRKIRGEGKRPGVGHQEGKNRVY